MPADIMTYCVIAVAVLITGLSKGGFAGIGMVSTPLVAIMVGPIAAAGIMLPIILVQDVVAVALYRRTVDWTTLRKLLPGAAVGIALAYVFVSSISEALVEILLGVISMGFALLQLRSGKATPAASSSGTNGSLLDRLLGFLAGLGSGFTSTIAHAGTPPFQIYAMSKGLPKELYIGTSVFFFATVNWLKVPAFVGLGQLTWAGIGSSLLFVPLSIATSWVGARLVRLVDVDQFRRIITLILLGIGALLIVQGAMGLIA
jgi:uncharacterized membrane protein YfcA